jgi:hypothetical protein
MSHNSAALVQVTNNFAYAALIKINHSYDTSPSETYSWNSVLPGTTSSPDMKVTFNLGWGAFGHDTWLAEVTVLDGPKKGSYVSNLAACTLHSPDNGAILTFSVSDDHFVVSASKNHDNPVWAVRP